MNPFSKGAKLGVRVTGGKKPNQQQAPANYASTTSARAGSMHGAAVNPGFSHTKAKGFGASKHAK